MEKEIGLVSIIIATYNVEQYIDRCIASVISQTYKKIQILIMDGRSKDSTISKILKWSQRDERIEITVRKDGGLGPARNYALQIAKGEYIVFLDGDDWLKNDYVEKAIHYAMLDENVDFVMSDFIIHSNDTGEENLAKSSWKDGIYSDTINKKRFLVYGNNSVWGKLIRKSMFERYVLLQPNLPFEDLGIYPALVLGSRKIAFCSGAVMYYLTNRSDSLFSDNHAFKRFGDVIEWSENLLKKNELWEENRSLCRFAMYKKFKRTYEMSMQSQNCDKNFKEELVHGQVNQYLYPYSHINDMTYWVFGGFALRWITHRLENGVRGLRRHFAFSGIISQFSTEFDGNIPEHNNSFRQSCIYYDFKKKLSNMLQNKIELPDFILIDFMNEIESVEELSDDCYITKSEPLYESNWVSLGRKLNYLDQGFFELWKKKCDCFIKLLKENLSLDQIILVKNEYAMTFVKEDKIFSYIGDIKEKNQLLCKMYDYFESKIGKIRSFILPKELVYTDMEKILYTAEPQYYNSYAYDTMAQEIEIALFTEKNIYQEQRNKQLLAGK